MKNKFKITYVYLILQQMKLWTIQAKAPGQLPLSPLHITLRVC